MKGINNYIIERLHITKETGVQTYKYFPKTKNELRDIIENRLKKDKNANLNDIDVSDITNMGSNAGGIRLGKGLFEGLDPHNIDISAWNVSNVTNMSYMFYNCRHFNCDLSLWDVSKVEDMSVMFYACELFNSDLSKWDVSKVEDMTDMFNWCKNFNCDLNKWNISNVKNIDTIFDGCYSLKNKPSWYKE